LHQFVISITGPDTESAIADMRAFASRCDLFELRLDRIRDADPPGLIAAAPKPVIATCRPQHVGGQFAGTEAERLSLLSQAGGLGAKYVDIELESAPGFDPRGAKLIVSHHDFSRVSENITEIRARINALEPAIAKLVCTAKGAEDNMAMLRLNRDSDVPTSAFCMGPAGLPSRVLGRKYGSRLTYAAFDAPGAAAPGQPTISLLENTYRVRSVVTRTAVYGILGNPALHSVGPVFHNGAFESLGLNAVYVPFETSDPDAFWQAFSPELKGLSVTTPFKRKALQLSKSISPEAKAAGAVNTLVRGRGGFNGHNTDIAGIRVPLAKRIGELRGLRVLVLGAGGAAMAAVYALTSEGAKVTIANRTETRAETLAARFEVQTLPWDERASVPCDIVINATTVGLRGEDNPLLPPEFFKPGISAFDLVYRAGGTAFLRTAAEAGANCIDGTEMFVAQAVEQLRLWTGKSLSPETVESLAARVRARLEI